MAHKDYSVLSSQPVSTRSLSPAERDAIVISAVVDSNGVSHVLSRFGDSVWQLWPFFDQANVQPARKRIDWSRVPVQYHLASKAALFRYWSAGSPGFAPPSANTLIRTYTAWVPLLRYLDRIGMRSLAAAMPIHIHNFIHEQRTLGVSAGSLAKYGAAIAILHRFHDESPQVGLRTNPWPEDEQPSGPRIGQVSSARTPLIPQAVLAQLYTFADGYLQRSAALLDERDAGIRSATTDPEIMRIRDSCFVLIGLLTGMRCDEIAGIEVNALRTEQRDDITFHWVRSQEHKTKKGFVEYLIPSIGQHIMSTMERWSAPLRHRLQKQIQASEADSHSQGGKSLQRIMSARSDANRLFLSLPRGRAGVATLSGIGWHVLLRRFARVAGVDWPLAPHQLRRTYAWTFVRHRLGNMLFLKEQFKHSSLAMTELYAANPHQDPALYDELMSEIRNFKVELIQHWMDDDVRLSGGAGRKIMELRANTYENRKDLIEETAESVHIRSNGHAWCLAQDEGCGGAGLYERSRCVGCSSGCIDDAYSSVWKEIYRHQLELAEDAKDLGPGAQRRIERDRIVALKVLTDLGISAEDLT